MQIEFTTEDIFGTDDGRVNLYARESKRNFMQERIKKYTRNVGTGVLDGPLQTQHLAVNMVSILGPSGTPFPTKQSYISPTKFWYS